MNATDKLGYTPLHFACYEGNVEVVRLLLDAGPDLEIKDAFGRTPLSAVLTAPKNKAGVISLLRERGATAGRRQAGSRTVVGLARWLGDPGVMRCFEDVPEKSLRARASDALDGGATALLRAALAADGLERNGPWSA